MKLHFSKILTDWYLSEKRDLPWRNTQDPYIIWLSEIILQQTRVAQGLPYFLKFIEQYPSVNLLANASEEEILKLWQGLGYYSRARNLHATAKMVVQEYNSIFPNTYKELIKLKGVGVYTASAIASFSNNEAVAVVDGNVYRVLSRIYGIFTPINSKEGEQEFKLLADSLLDKEDSAMHNQAIMEFGALGCTPKKPNCETCPFTVECYSFKNNTIDTLPVKLKKNKVRKRYFVYVIVKLPNNEILLRKRGPKDIWQHLYEFPMVESDSELTELDLKKEVEELFEVAPIDLKCISALEKPHKLSHQHLYARFYSISIAETDKIKIGDYTVATLSSLEDYPVPVLISNFLKNYIFITRPIL